MAHSSAMGDVQHVLGADFLPPPRQQRRRMPERLTPHMRKWLTKLARIGARINWTIELLYDPRKGGQGELCERAKAGDHTLVLDTVREGEHQLSLLGDEIDDYMRPDGKCPHPPGSRAKVELLAVRRGALRALFVDGDAR